MEPKKAKPALPKPQKPGIDDVELSKEAIAAMRKLREETLAALNASHRKRFTREQILKLLDEAGKAAGPESGKD